MTRYRIDKRTMGFLISLGAHGSAALSIVATYRALLGAKAYDDATTIDPTAIKIPKAQWLELCRSTVDAPDYLQWMNVGPSGYEDAPAQESVGVA